MENQLELRMYFFVPYQLIGIQQAIQAGHAALEYADKYGSEEEFIIFVRKYKTWIILNGGTTNDMIDQDGFYYGSLNQIEVNLITNEILYSSFHEPDLNNALTAICFICDERVWDYEQYPNFVDYILNVKMCSESEHISPQTIIILKTKTLEELQKIFPEYYKEWVDFIGREKNIFLRELIKGKKLA